MQKTILYILFIVLGITNSYSQQTNPYLTKLNSALIRDDYQTALVYCDSLVLVDSTQTAQSNYYKALIYKSMFRYKDALEHISNSISVDSTNIDYQMELGRILYQRGKLSLADSVFSSVFSLDTTNLSAGIYLSRIKLKSEKFQEALDVYLKLAELDTMNSYFNKQAGFCFIKIGKSNKSIPYLKKAILLDSTDTQSYEYIGIVYQAKNMHDTAIYFMEKAIEQAPDDAGLYFKLAEIHDSRNHFYQAIPNYLKAWELGLHDYETAAQLGICYFMLGNLRSPQSTTIDTAKLNKAKEFLQIALELEKNNGAYNYLGRTYMALGETNNALKCYNAALKLMQPEPLLLIQLYSDLAEAYEANEEYDKAIETWLDIKDVEPGGSSLAFYTKEMFLLLYHSRVDMQIARIYETHLNKKEEALKLYEQIVAANDDISTREKSYAEERVKVLKEELFFENGVTKK